LNALRDDFIRIIPTILINGINVVKGRNFVNDRVVGNAFAVAKIYGRRFIDELMILDVAARSEGRLAELEIAETFARELTVPFSIGGGIRSLEDALRCIDSGAEKIVIGSEVLENLDLLEEISSVLGSQAIVVSLVFDSNHDEIFLPHEKKHRRVNLEKMLEVLQSCGCGELLIQSRIHDGYMNGTNLRAITDVSKAVSIPAIAGSGFGSVRDVMNAIEAGATAVAIGSLFLFTETTPQSLAEELKREGIQARTS
jgi:cyclase